MLKECAEEAGISRQLASSALPAGGVSYTSFSEDGWGVKRDVLFAFDLQLPASFQPCAVDGEVEGFTLEPLETIVTMLASSEKLFKPNVGMAEDVLVWQQLTAAAAATPAVAEGVAG